MEYDIFYHEAAHVVIASLFPEAFIVDFVTLNKEETESYDKLSLGGMKGQPVQNAQERTAIGCDALVLIFLAGMCADDIHIHGVVKEDFFTNEIWMDKFYQGRYSGDIGLINREFGLMIEKKYYHGLYNDYIIPAMRVVYRVLADASVWRIVELIRNTLCESKSKRMTNEELKTLLSQEYFVRWKEINLQQINDGRKSFFDNAE